MKPKQGKPAKQASERKRDFRNGPSRERETAANNVDSDDDNDSGLSNRTKKERQVAAAALRQRVDASGKVGKRGKHSTKQKRRKEELMAKGEAFNDRIIKKATDTAASQKHIKRRNADWDAVNENAFDVLMQADENQQTLIEE